MNEEQLISQIKNQLEQVRSLDRTRLSPPGEQAIPWNNFTNTGLNNFVNNALDSLLLLSKKEGLAIYGWNTLSSLNSSLTNLINSIQGYAGLNPHQITSHHHQALIYLDAILNVLRSTGLYTELKFDLKNETGKIRNAISFADDIIKNKPAFDASIEVFKEALQGREEFTNSIINEKGQLFLNASKEHALVHVLRQGRTDKFLSLGFRIPAGNIWQLIFALFCALAVLFMVFDFIRLGEVQKEIGVGFAILRVSALIIPSYFAFFFSRQYIIGKKLYEFYKFKAVALNTLSNLYGLYPNQQPSIMEKALAVIFSEFNEKTDGDISQKDMLGLISNLTKNIKG